MDSPFGDRAAGVGNVGKISSLNAEERAKLNEFSCSPSGSGALTGVEDDAATVLPPILIKQLMSKTYPGGFGICSVREGRVTSQTDIPSWAYYWDTIPRLRRTSYEALLKEEPAAALEYVDDEGDKIMVGSGLELAQRLDETGPIWDKGCDRGTEMIHVFNIKDDEKAKDIWLKQRRNAWRDSNQVESAINYEAKKANQSKDLEQNPRVREFSFSKAPKTTSPGAWNPPCICSSDKKKTQKTSKSDTSLTSLGQRSVKTAAEVLSSRRLPNTTNSMRSGFPLPMIKSQNPWASYQALPSSFTQNPYPISEEPKAFPDGIAKIESLENEFDQRMSELKCMIDNTEKLLTQEREILNSERMKLKDASTSYLEQSSHDKNERFVTGRPHDFFEDKTSFSHSPSYYPRPKNRNVEFNPADPYAEKKTAQEAWSKRFEASNGSKEDWFEQVPTLQPSNGDSSNMNAWKRKLVATGILRDYSDEGWEEEKQSFFKVPFTEDTFKKLFGISPKIDFSKEKSSEEWAFEAHEGLCPFANDPNLLESVSKLAFRPGLRNPDRPEMHLSALLAHLDLKMTSTPSGHPSVVKASKRANPWPGAPAWQESHPSEDCLCLGRSHCANRLIEMGIECSKAWDASFEHKGDLEKAVESLMGTGFQ